MSIVVFGFCLFSDQIRSKLQSFEAQGVEIIVVDISRRGVGTALQNLILRRENYIRFSGSITGQDQLHRSLIERTCTALTRPIEEGTPEEV
ncbi:hypothetical protein Bpfe_015928 [Biomphalaria pfeifferi]|uniref:Uncharacterized protein n=1 Tax=Biomphalaria pfeifferi TaxID=112525 RepID=A0AAD8BH88_BIOPF|nr:hypothetical protein Bpfe_015928 [Biomphalaria pfeifferi]